MSDNIFVKLAIKTLETETKFEILLEEISKHDPKLFDKISNSIESKLESKVTEKRKKFASKVKKD